MCDLTVWTYGDNRSLLFSTQNTMNVMLTFGWLEQLFCSQTVGSQECCHVWWCLSLKSKFTHHIKTCISELNLMIPGQWKIQWKISLCSKDSSSMATQNLVQKSEVYWTPPPPEWLKVTLMAWQLDVLVQLPLLLKSSNLCIFRYMYNRNKASTVAPVWLLWVRMCVYSLFRRKKKNKFNHWWEIFVSQREYLRNEDTRWQHS